MSLAPSDVWTRLLDRARHELPEQVVRTWLEPSEALKVEGNTLFVGVPDRFAADWNESKHGQLLASLAPVALGHPLNVVFRVHEEQKTRPQMDFFVAPLPEKGTPAEALATANSQLSGRYTFGNFVIGKSNELAAAAAQAVAHDILQRNPRTRLAFIGTEQFTNELVGSIQGRTTQQFRQRYREIDLLLVDDIHFLKGKEATQEEFFHTFNALYEAGRQIILTSDRPPSEIPGLEARLVSRFQWGMVADIEQPDLEHRTAILRNKAALDHLELTIPDDVISFIAENVRSSVRELEGSIIRLLAYASLKHRQVTVELAREALRDKLKTTQGTLEAQETTISVATIQAAVATEWGVTVEGLRSKVRTKTLTVPRQVSMFLIRELLGLQLVEIGSAFGGRDHSTVIHSLDRVQAQFISDNIFQSRVQRIRRQLELARH